MSAGVPPGTQDTNTLRPFSAGRPSTHNNDAPAVPAKPSVTPPDAAIAALNGDGQVPQGNALDSDMDGLGKGVIERS